MRIRANVGRDSDVLLERWSPKLKRRAFLPGATNLASYLALRQHDLTRLQPELSALGLSSLGRSESRVLPNLDVVLERLSEMAGKPVPKSVSGTNHGAGERILSREKRKIFGADPLGPATRILVTLPALAADDPQFAKKLIADGADCFRINCAHDGPDVWLRMIAHCRAASAEAGRECPILMDIAGPKCRIAKIAAPGKSRIFRDDTVLLSAKARKRANCISMAVTFPEVLAQVPAGSTVLLDDGSVEMLVEPSAEDGLILRVLRAPKKGQKLRPGKGMNFPGIDLNLPALTAKDFEDLDFVAEHADLVGLSFVRNASDVALMQDELSLRRASRPPQPIVIKVETPSAVENLPDIVVQGAGRQPMALMIARGDLAVEVGFGRIGELQEQILWLCEAAHIPVIWATEVLAGLVKTGSPSRAEATDASMAQRAECVMLNKGPHLHEAVQFLDGVLHRMDRHQSKKSARLRPLDVWAIGGGAEKAMLRSPAVAAHLDGDQGTRRLHVNKCEL